VKALEQLTVRARSRIRQERARFGLGGRPARLVVRLDDLDAPGAVPAAALTVDGWFDAIVRVVEWSGALPVVVVSRPDHPHLAEIVRFAHRLECPTALRTAASGLTAARADELVDCGLERVVLRVAGVSEGVQAAVLGETVADTRRAIAALREARESRAVALDIVLEVPFSDRTAPELRALFQEAGAVGVDGVVAAAPWVGGNYEPGSLEVLGWLQSQQVPLNRTPSTTFELLRAMRGGGPGLARTRGACPVGTLQVELLPDGTLRSCPFKGDTATLRDDMEPAWKALAAHRDAIRACDRACAHPLLSS